MTNEQPSEPYLRRFLRQLRERKMVQWAVAYAAGAWLLLQVIDIIGPRWGLTDLMSKAVDVVLVVGFAVTLVLAWYHGEQGRQRVNGVELLILGALLLIGGIGLRLVDVEAPQTPPATAESATPAPAEPVSTDASSTVSEERLRTIAVLPFDNYSPNPDDAYFAAGITEEITGQLARIGDLTVLSRVAVERAVESEDSLEEIARVLGAGTVLEGSVRMAGSQVRITAQLIEVTSQRHLWSDNFDRELTDIFQIQTDVALAIGDALLAQLSSDERRRIVKPATDNIRAYQLYLKQQELLGSRLAENREAIDLLEQALALDPEFAVARARLSWRHTWVSRMTGSQEAAEHAEQLAREALAQDPDLARAYHALGAALGELERMEEAGIAYERAYELDPNENIVLTDGSIHYATTGEPAKGLEMAFSAVRLDPNNPNRRWHAAMPLLFLGDRERTGAWLKLARDEGMRFHRLAAAEADLALLSASPEKAAQIARTMRDEYPESREANMMALNFLFVTGNWLEVSKELLTLGEASPDLWAMNYFSPRSMRTIRAFILSRQGETEAASQVFDEVLNASQRAVADGSTFQGRALDAASVYAFRGQRAEALGELERAFDLGFRTDYALAIDPLFVSLHDDPRFQSLLERMAESQREQREIAQRTGALEGYDALIAAGPVQGETP